MITIVNQYDPCVYDEIGWGDTAFYENDIASYLITYHMKFIYKVEFYSVEKVICIRINLGHGKLELDYWFRDITPNLLNTFCQIPKFRGPVKRFFMCSGFKSFNVEKNPLLAATLLGNNNEY